MALYHFQVGFPKNAQWPCGTYDLKYSQHALREAAGDRYGDISFLLPDELDTQRAKVIEAEIVGRRVVKIVYRVRLDASRDLCLVVNTDCTPWFVRTVWVNDHADGHRTLNTSKYARVFCA